MNTNHVSSHLSLFLADEDRARKNLRPALVLVGEHPVYDCIALHYGIATSPLLEVKGKVGRRHRMFYSGRFCVPTRVRWMRSPRIKQRVHAALVCVGTTLHYSRSL